MEKASTEIACIGAVNGVSYRVMTVVFASDHAIRQCKRCDAATGECSSTSSGLSQSRKVGLHMVIRTYLAYLADT